MNSAYTKKEIEKIVNIVRLELHNYSLFCGAKAIKERLEEYEIHPLPSESTIGRILSRHGLTHGRTGNYQEHMLFNDSKNGKY
ncbi:MAG: hypothetical protein PF503_21810 [Desulfobacula sp.]|jgi:hypothetical protein|nr:hypothetical protein [Desulfobacula sp.]